MESNRQTMNNSITVHGVEIRYAHKHEFFRHVEEGKWEPESFDVLDKYLVEDMIFILGLGKESASTGYWNGIYVALIERP